MISLTIDHRKAIENTALAAGTIAGVIGALMGIGGLSAIAYAPVVLERIIIAGYDKVSPVVKRQFYLVMKKTFNNVEKELKKKNLPTTRSLSTCSVLLAVGSQNHQASIHCRRQ